MTNLISGADALIALANGEEVQHFNKKMATFGNLVKDEEWGCCDELIISDFNSDLWAFRLKPRTITINGIEIPAPFEPNHGDEIWFLNPDYGCGYADGDYDPAESVIQFGAWRTEDEIKQVVAALRQIFGGV